MEKPHPLHDDQDGAQRCQQHIGFVLDLSQDDNGRQENGDDQKSVDFHIKLVSSEVKGKQQTFNDIGHGQSALQNTTTA